MNMLAYRMDSFSREEMAAEDPFEGRGVFLAAPGIPGADIITALSEALGVTVPAVAWDGIGAWIDPGSTGMSTELVQCRWDGGKSGERR